MPKCPHSPIRGLELATDNPDIFATLLIAMTKYCKSDIKKEDFYFGSQFKGAHCGEGMASK